MSDRTLSHSPLLRFAKLGGLVGRVGVSVASQQLLNLGRSAENRRQATSQNLVDNALRIVATLGELKGAAMKVGQMLSLHETLLPPEVAAVLRTLQREAPRIPFEVVGYELDSALPRWRQIFATIEPEAFAAASIGQVHRATLADGRQVAVKIQYPLIDQIVEADLGNLRRVMQALFGLFSTADFEPVWGEVRDRLREELDYLHEASMVRRMAELHRDVPSVVIPAVIDEATTHNVLTLEYLEGIAPDAACSERYDQELRDRWGQALFELLLRGLFAHRLLHADPNLANFAFRADGRIVVFDFGCVKEIPEPIAAGYRDLSRATLAGRAAEIPEVLRAMGVCSEKGEPVAVEVVEPYLELFAELLREAPPYRFGDDGSVYKRLMDLGWDNLGTASTLRFPRDVVFIDRALAGHFGNLNRLHAAGPWRALVERYVGRPA
jgi:predicted unusual protein kinase regulating ubiquinone biosynthesis (AarF/ABC1/UbiB family)